MQKSVCNGCHDLLMMSSVINNIAIITIEGVDCRCIIYGVSKSDIIYLTENYVVNDRGFIQNVFERSQ